MRGVTLATALLACVAIGACSGGDDAVSSLPLPPSTDFSVVNAVLGTRCGSLDCHGSPARNLRIYGVYGLRADGVDVTGGVDTTDADVAATYAAVVSIHPEVLSRVYEAGGDDAASWIVLGKGRGIQQHEGGARLVEGTPADDCLVSWIEGSVDVEVCAADTFAPVPREGETW